MITKTKNLQSKHLDLQHIERKQLSIQFSLDGFSFVIFDLNLQEFTVLTEYTFDYENKNPEKLLIQIKQVFTDEEKLFHSFEKVLVVHINNLSTFVPIPLFDENHLETYLKYNNKIYNNDFFVYDTIAHQDMVSVFIPYVHINNFLIDQFGSFEYKHYSSILVEKLLNNYDNKNTVLYIHVEKTHFEIIVSKNKKLLFYNTFNYKTEDDFLYFVLFTIEQLNLNTEMINVKLLGKITTDHFLFLALYKYIRNISLLDFKTIHNTILPINEHVQRNHFCLFNTIN